MHKSENSKRANYRGVISVIIPSLKEEDGIDKTINEIPREELEKMTVFQLNNVIKLRKIRISGRRVKANLIDHILDHQDGDKGFVDDFYTRFSKWMDSRPKDVTAGT